MKVTEAKKKFCPVIKLPCKADGCMLWTYATRNFEEVSDEGYCGLKNL